MGNTVRIKLTKMIGLLTIASWEVLLCHNSWCRKFGYSVIIKKFILTMAMHRKGIYYHNILEWVL